MYSSFFFHPLHQKSTETVLCYKELCVCVLYFSKNLQVCVANFSGFMHCSLLMEEILGFVFQKQIAGIP